MSLDAGTRIGRYEIQSLIGVGGMGEVYRALDTELNRTVALKFLHSDVAADQDRMSRFIQEARAASALNHPNILTVFDIGQTEEGARFFATEFVQGTTLREQIAGRRLKLGDALDIAAQIASALAAAHAEGIVHRDIKPENVMVRADGYVKVLDFGLAKVTNRNSGALAAVDTEAATRALVNTNPGAIMGTVAYMSPEQARGEAVDARTDIWSLGCVFYEMLTGHVPFEGRSASHVIVNILDAEPVPLAHYLADAPEALQEVVADALTKDRDARFQTAKQMLVKLQRLRQRLDAGVSLDHSVVPGFSASTAGGALGAGTLTSQVAGRTFASAAGAGRTTAGDIAPQDTVQNSGAGNVAAHGERRGSFTFTPYVMALIAVVVLGGLAFGVYRFTRGANERAVAPFASLQNMKFTKLQAAGQTMIATLSPDGKYVARTVYEGGKSSVRVRQVATTTEKELVAPSESDYTGLTFSPDGAFLYYVTVPLGGNLGELYRVPSLLGGAPQKITSDVDSAVTFSPDGKRFAFRRHIPDTGDDTIVTASEDGGGERTIVSRKAPIILPSLAWSPDGRQIAYAVKGTDEQGYYMSVESVRPEGGAGQVVSNARWRSIGILAWLSDGSGLIFNGRDRASLPSTPEQIWFVAFPGGEAQKITNDLNFYKSVSLTADSRTLLALQSNYSADIWLSGAGGGGAARQLTSEGSAGTPAWTPDGRIVYQSGVSGNGDIWVMNADGTGARQLTFDPNNDTSPEVSPDGRLIVFISNRSVGWSIWLMNADGSGQRELVRNVEQYSFPHFAPDSRTVYYTSRDEGGGRNAFWRVGVEGSAPARVSEQAIGNARLSPDGKLFFTMQSPQTPNAPRRIVVMPVAGGPAVREFDAPPALDMPRWSPDSQALDYVVRREGASGLWRLPLAPGSQPRQLSDLKTYFINWYSWSPDGRQLAVARGNPVTDLILIKDFK
ncbi:MAG TPA: protein kinase [Pyrinomonadaceae bacterium]|jgi:Tol biopolymer transport system component/tRNA A-37 threonylcarbamoyl transferase component Bud32